MLIEGNVCPICDGTGKILRYDEERRCYACDGDGKLWKWVRGDKDNLRLKRTQREIYRVVGWLRYPDPERVMAFLKVADKECGVEEVEMLGDSIVRFKFAKPLTPLAAFRLGHVGQTLIDPETGELIGNDRRRMVKALRKEVVAVGIGVLG